MSILKTRTPAKPVSALSIPPLTERDVMVIKQLNRGEADMAAQQYFLEFLVTKLCGVGSHSYDESNPYTTAFREGKRCVAVQLLEIITAPMEVLVDKKGERK